MEAYDFIMLAVLALATLFGAWKGLAWQVASLGSIFASYFVAYQFREPVAQMIKAAPPWNKFLAMLILYLAASLAIWLAFRFVSEFIDRVKLKEFDRHAGAVLGFSRGVLWCVIITLFAVTLLGDSQKQSIIDSRSGYYIAVLLDKSHAVMPEEVHDVLGPYIHSLDARLDERQRFSHREDEPGSGATQAGNEARESLFSPANILNENRSQSSDTSGDAVQSWLRKMGQTGFGGQD
jgi:membrane protein required for colicin V production